MPSEPPTDNRLAVYEAIASVIAASAAVLATRVILLLSLIGGFVIAILAAESATWLPLGVLCAYAILIVIPLVVLEMRTRWNGGA